jgi:hypothetical protein
MINSGFLVYYPACCLSADVSEHLLVPCSAQKIEPTGVPKLRPINTTRREIMPPPQKKQNLSFRPQRKLEMSIKTKIIYNILNRAKPERKRHNLIESWE